MEYLKDTWLSKNDKQNNYLIKEIKDATCISQVTLTNDNYNYNCINGLFRLEFMGFCIYPGMCINLGDYKYDIKDAS